MLPQDATVTTRADDATSVTIFRSHAYADA